MVKIRYLVFEFPDYYPGGGMNDVVLKTDNIYEVKDFVNIWNEENQDFVFNNIHIFDVIKGEIIYEAGFEEIENNGKRERVLKIKGGV